MSSTQDFKNLLNKYEYQEIIHLAEKQNISYEEAKILREGEKIIDNKLKVRLISDALSFKYDTRLIINEIKPYTTENKKRIRYIIQNSIGKINSFYRHVYVNSCNSRDYERSKKLKLAFYEAKDNIWKLRYREREYFELISNFFIEYLNKCYVIFFEFLLIHNKEEIFKKKDFLKDKILKSVIAYPIQIDLLKDYNNYKKEIETEFEKSLLELEKYVDNQISQNEKFKNLNADDYENAVMKALKNGYGEIFGF